jgi:DNA polymerase III epsilon subunit-like protein
MSLILTLDFEASCLPSHGRSFPIEVAVAGPGGFARSWLIRPHADWQGWTWTEEAERLHGLSYEHVQRAGMSVDRVLDELAEAVGGCKVVADSYCDVTWMRTLERAAGAPERVRVQHVDALIHQLKISDADAWLIAAETDLLNLRRHRAADDARRLQALVTRLRTHAAREIAPRARQVA